MYVKKIKNLLVVDFGIGADNFKLNVLHLLKLLVVCRRMLGA